MGDLTFRGQNSIETDVCKKKNFGFICGRFQPVHFGHFEFIDAARSFVHKFYIGITNPDLSSINAVDYVSSDLQRTRPESNIFSFFERKKMIDALMKRYFPKSDYEVIKCDLNRFDKVLSKLPDNLVLMNTIYDNWGRDKQKIFEKTGKRFKILWEREKKITHAGDVRHHIANKWPWEHLVPISTQEIINDIGLKKIRNRTHMPPNGDNVNGHELGEQDSSNFGSEDLFIANNLNKRQEPNGIKSAQPS